MQHLRVVGGIKVPLVDDHKIRMAFKEESDIRHLLAQPIQYNSDGDIKPNRWPIGDPVVLWHLASGHCQDGYRQYIVSSSKKRLFEFINMVHI